MIDGITDAEMDNQGNLYVATQNGSIRKYDSLGLLLNTYSSATGFGMDQIDVSANFRIFAFSQSDQRYILLDRNLNLLFENRFDEQYFGEIAAATYQSDQQIWIYNANDFSLKKIDPVRFSLTASLKLNLLLTKRINIIEMKGYQNRIYINNDASEIFVFDFFGNYHKTLPVGTAKKIGFYRNEIFFLSSDTLSAIDLYTNKVRIIIPAITEAGSLLKIIWNDRFYLEIYENKIIKKTG